MIEEHHGFDRILILADESANWQIAGVRQLDRLLLGLDEFAKAMGMANKIEAVVFWKSEIPLSERLLPKKQRITRVRLTEASGGGGPEARILTTRLFITRNALTKFFSTTPPVKIEQPTVDLTEAWPQLFEQFERTCRSATSAAEEHWRLLAHSGEIAAGEKYFLRHIGKSQDGMVSRFLNRPISRAFTRLLLNLPITPNLWTILIFALAPVACVFLIRGDYTGFLVATAVFQLINILDGCDGEIARAKYLDSERGRRLDAFCDFVANLIFVFCLGVGLFRQPSVSANLGLIYLVESLITSFIMASGFGRFFTPLLAGDTKGVVSRRQEDFKLAERFFGRVLPAFIYQLTQRDVIYFVFLLLAIVNRASWILHIVFAFSVITLGFRLFRRSRQAAVET
jgi:hypothetical protein